MPTDTRDLKVWERLIWSADVADELELFRRLETMPGPLLVKIDRNFVTDAGLSVIRAMGETGFRVFDDAKIIEIPSKLAEITKKHLKQKPFMLNCMAGSVSNSNYGAMPNTELDGLKRFADLCNEAGTMPVGVTVLTSKTQQIVREEFEVDDVSQQVLWYVEQLREAGFGGVVCSPQEVAAIRCDSDYDEMELLTPGVRLRGGDTRDQARVDTPCNAIRAGATRVVCGSEITGDPSGAKYAEILADIGRALADDAGAVDAEG